jgi:hypothetical protein
MKPILRNSQITLKRCGLTRVELLFIIIPICILLFVFLAPTDLPTSTDPKKINCIYNLETIGQNYASWAQEHNGLLPFTVSTNEGGTMEFTNASDAYIHFQVLSNYFVTAGWFVCPADLPRFRALRFPITNSNLSYFINIDARHSVNLPTILSGDRNITGSVSMIQQGCILLNSGDFAGWDNYMHVRSGNVLLSDGSVSNLTTRNLKLTTNRLITNQTRLLIP